MKLKSNHSWIKIIVIIGLLLSLNGTTSTLANPSGRIIPGLPVSIDALPVADNQAISTSEEVSINIKLTATDEDGDSLEYSIVSLPANGVLNGNPKPPNLIYTPNLDFFGTDSFTFIANDGTGDSNIATVTITVTNVNDLPIAVADLYETTVNTPLVVTAATGLLANDIDPDDDTLIAIRLDDVDHGILTFRDDGSFVYKPDNNYSGEDTFTYSIFDGVAMSACALVTINVGVGNTPPEAAVDTYNMYSDMTLTVDAASGLLANDTDEDGDLLSARFIGGIAFGTLVLNPDGSFVYTPNANYVGSDRFTYYANDGTEDSLPTLVTINIALNPNHEPVAVLDRYGMFSGTTLTVAAAEGVLKNDIDVDGDMLVAHLLSNPTFGALTFNGDGSFEYTPTLGYFGADHFTYQVEDWLEKSNIVEVTILVMVDPNYQLFLPTVLR
jgi:hypothetical protein